MGLFLSVDNEERASSVVQEERIRQVTIALEEYDDAKRDGTTWESTLYLVKHWEFILPRWKQMLVLYAGILLLSGVGGIIFHLCEYSHEADLLNERAEFLSHLEYTYQNNTDQLDMILTWGQEAQEFVYPTEEFPDGRNKWQFRYACFFAATTFTTNGFGLQATATSGGKIAVLIYGIPAIGAYVWISKSIGYIVLDFFERSISYCGCMTYEFYAKKRLSLIASLALVFSLLMSWVIFSIRTDEGFGNGVYTYFDAFYFLFQTTMTIGYGDVMMSGGSMIGTGLLGCWLATSIGVVFCLLSEIGDKFNYHEDDEYLSPKTSDDIGSASQADVQVQMEKIEEEKL